MTLIKKIFLRLILPILIFFVFLYPLYSISNMLNEQNEPNVLRLANDVAVETLNNMLTENVNSSLVISNFMEGLVGYNKENKLIPQLAERWEKEGLVYKFYLRNNLKWENEENLTAKDFEFSWKTAIKNIYAPYSYILDVIKNGEKVRNGELSVEELGVKAIDDKILQIELEKENVSFLEMLVQNIFFPINENFYKKIGPQNYGTSKDTVLSCGPFTLTKFSFDSGYTLEKNPHYWNKDNINLNKIHMSLVKQSTTQSAMFESGQLDALNLSSDLYDKYIYEDNYKNNIKTFLIPSLFYLYVSGNTKQYSKVLSNNNFRKALNYSLDKKSITEYLLKNGSQPLDYIVPFGFGDLDGIDFRHFTTHTETLYNLDKAQEYLKKAKEELKEEPLYFEISYSENENNKRMFENIKSQLETKLPGVKIKLNSMPSNNYFKHLSNFSTMAAYGGWTPDYEDINSFLQILETENSFNYGQYKNKKFDDLIYKGDHSSEKKESWINYKQAEELAIEDVPIIPLFQEGRRYLLNPKVKGFNYNAISPVINFRFITKE